MCFFCVFLLLLLFFFFGGGGVGGRGGGGNISMLSPYQNISGYNNSTHTIPLFHNISGASTLPKYILCILPYYDTKTTFWPYFW